MAPWLFRGVFVWSNGYAEKDDDEKEGHEEVDADEEGWNAQEADDEKRLRAQEVVYGAGEPYPRAEGGA